MTALDLFTVCSKSIAISRVEQRDLDHFKAYTALCASLHLTRKGREEYCKRFVEIARALHWAAETNEPTVIHQIVRITGQQFLEIGDYGGRTAMHEAARRGHAAALKALLQGGAEFNATYSTGNDEWRSVLDELVIARSGHLDPQRGQAIHCGVLLRKQGAESHPSQQGIWQPRGYKSMLEEIDRAAAAENQACAAALHAAPHLRTVPSDVLHLVEDYANLPNHR